MPDLVPRSGLEHLVLPGRVGAATQTPGFTVALVQERSLAAVMVRKNSHADLAAAVNRTFGVELPTTPRIVSAGAVSFVWTGPGRWFAMSERTPAHAFVTQLQLQLAQLATVIDQSDAHVLMRLSGPRVRDVLAKGVLIDLHPRAFQVGDAAVTSIAHFRAHFWQTDGTPTYEVAVMRTFATAFWRWLLEAGAVYGVLVQDA